ncbi:MAG: winged helix-turn-helix domain-containing protein [Pseudomonadales bacterium]|nr:winged helix-turn-helix domain-containing protein [Pseudomonadales bacterium]
MQKHHHSEIKSTHQPVAHTTHETKVLSSDFYLDKWLVRPESNQLFLLQDGNQPAQAVQLEPRIMRLLCILAGNAGRVVERDLLMNLLWPKVVVNENSLTRAVSELRKALRPGIQTAPLPTAGIKTVSKAGYCLTAGVHENGHLRDFPAGVEGMEKNTGNPWITGKKPVMAQAAAVVLGLGLGFGLGMFQGTPIIERPLVTINSSILPEIDSSLPGTQSLADIRLDQPSTNAPIISSSLHQDSELPTRTNGLITSVVSPDGELFAAVDYNASGSSLMLGSAHQSSSPVVVYSTSELIYNLQWAPLDNLLLFAQKPKLSPASENADKQLSRLMLFDLESMTVTQIHKNPAEGQPVEPEQAKEKQYSKLT